MSTIQVTDAGANLYRDSSKGSSVPKITYVALGTSTTSPTAADTKLGNEVYRKAVTSFTNGSAGEIFINMYLGPLDAVGDDIEEVGFFGGSSATSSANTGVLLARGLWHHNPKTNLESIQFQLDFTFTHA
jgi:hypothetical protein